jgi:formylglycine-generating enzyme required for sulfatase activity
MIGTRGVMMMAVVVAMVLPAAGPIFGQEHAPWPTNWNNWNDPALWVTVGNPGNAPDTRYATPGYGAVAYTFNMGKFEVTAGQYTAFLNAVAKTDTYELYRTEMDTAVSQYACNIKRAGSSDNYTYSVASDWANRPVNFVGWGDAARFANWLTNGKPTGAQNLRTTEDGSYYLNGATSDAALMHVTRKSPEQGGRYYIPTEDEWYKAAYHKNDGLTNNYFDYPTGSYSLPSNDLLTPDGGNNANIYQSGWAIGSPYYRTEVGDFENSESPYGAFDLTGNVAEWNEGILDSYHRGLRGGSFGSDTASFFGAAYRYIFGPMGGNNGIGFRVSEVPEPATMSLLALGGVLVLMRRREKN